MYFTAQVNNAVLLRKKSSTLQATALHFTINRSYKMRYCMIFYLNGHRIDYTLRFNEIKNAFLKSSDLHHLINMRNSGHRSSDFFICYEIDKTIKVMSYSDISKCN